MMGKNCSALSNHLESSLGSPRDLIMDSQSSESLQNNRCCHTKIVIKRLKIMARNAISFNRESIKNIVAVLHCLVELAEYSNNRQRSKQQPSSGIRCKILFFLEKINIA